LFRNNAADSTIIAEENPHNCCASEKRVLVKRCLPGGNRANPRSIHFRKVTAKGKVTTTGKKPVPDPS
jgi:hypothetical protein